MPGTMLKSQAGWMPVCLALCVLAHDGVRAAKSPSHHPDGTSNQVLEWNQVFIDTLIATNTANSSSQRLGAIVHTAMFDALQRDRTTLHADLCSYRLPREGHRAAPRSSRVHTRHSPPFSRHNKRR